MEGIRLSTFEWLRQPYDGRMDTAAVTTTTVESSCSRPPIHLADWSSATSTPGAPPAPATPQPGHHLRSRSPGSHLNDSRRHRHRRGVGIGHGDRRTWLHGEVAVSSGVDRDYLKSGLPGGQPRSALTAQPTLRAPAHPSRRSWQRYGRVGRARRINAGGPPAPHRLPWITEQEWLDAFS